ncbi:hypothetical protein CL634_01865 [bacterium]|nr:hypothetical protein [bacterium]
MTSLSHREVIGIVEQSVIGTFVTPVMMIPVTSFSAEEIFEHIVDNGRRGVDSLDFRAAQGVKRFNISFEGNLQFNPGSTTIGGSAVGKLLRSIFGSGTVTPVRMIDGSAATDDTHNSDFQLGTSKEYFSIEHNAQLSGSKARQFSGCRVQELTISWNAGEGALTFSCNMVGREMALAAGTDLTAQVATIEAPIQGWRVNVAFNAAIAHNTPNFTRLISAEWRLARTLTPIYSGQQTQLYQDIYAGPLEATVAMVLDYTVDTDLALFRAGTQVPIVNKFKIGTNSSAKSLRRFYIASELVSLLEAPAVIDSSAENLTLAISGRCLYSTGTSVITSSGESDEAGDAAFGPTPASPIAARLTDERVAASTY